MLAQRWLRNLYTLEAARIGGSPVRAGALCWRWNDDSIEFLLVTSRRSRRWGIPKGWSLRGRSLCVTAEREAWEEAGVIGRAHARLLCLVPAPKQYRLVGQVDWLLAVYPMEVGTLVSDWPERGQRERRWFSVEEASDVIRPKALRPFISAFAAGQVRQPSPEAPPRPSPSRAA